MNKKKAGLLIIVLFLIIGLGSFVFANPDNQENFEEGDIEERDRQGSDRDGSSSSDDSSNEDETDSDVLLTDGSDNQLGNAVNNNSRGNNLFGNDDSTLPDGTGQTSGPDEVPVDNIDYYADALKAVEQAESSLVQGDVDYAASLVDKVTNQSQKDELNKRLDAVQDIIDVTALIERLEEMVANSTNRDGIIESIDYRDDEKIEELVTNLNNGTAKDNLASRLETVNKILNDIEGPDISGIDNNSFTNEDVSLTISDDNEVTTKVTLNGEEIEYIDAFTEEGTYVVTVVDAAFNETIWTFTIDKHVEEPKWVYILNVSDENNRKTIRDGQTLRVEVNFDEELTELPVLTIGNSQSVTFRKCNETDYGKYVCVADITIDNTVANLKDGEEIPFTITNIYDKAGNTITLDNANVTETKEYGQVTYDGSAPVVKSLGVTDINEFKDEVGKLYAKNGDTVRVLVYFDEKLGIEPTVKLGGKEFTATYREDSPKYAYYADIKLTEDMNLSDGVLPFEVYGYADEIGNVGVNLTEKDVNNTTYPSVTIDNTLPVLNFHNGFITSGYTVEATDDNFAYMTVQYYDGRGTETIESNTFTLDKEGDNTRYNIKAYDKAGNVSEYRDIYLDNANPVVSGTAINGGEEVSVENNGTYQEVTLNISDGSLKKVSLVKEDGTEEVLETYKDNYKNTKLTFEKKYTEEGTYTIKAVDRNNNESTITFTIDKTPATRVYSTLDFDKSGKQYYEVDKEKVYYVKNGDSFVFRMQFSEALKTAPTVEVGGMKVPMTLNEKFLNNEGKYIYEGTVNITEEAKLSQGRLEIVLSNVVDMAGNESTDEVVLNQTPTSNGRVAIYDKTVPSATKVQIINNSNPNSDYIKNGETIRVRATFNESLKIAPVLTIGNYTATFENVGDGKGNDLYSADITIKEDESELKEGKVAFTITGYTDLAGNTGDKITEDSVKSNITYDRTAPEVISLTQEYQAKEDGRIKVTITTSEDVSGDAFHDYAWRKTGDNTYVNYYYKSEEVVINFVDQANNSGSYTFTVDADAPEILSLTQEYQAKEGGRIKVTITTSEEIYGDSVNKNGWRKVGDNTYENYYYRTKDVTINVTDKVGNPLVYIFTVDMDAPEVVVTKSNNDKSTNKNVIVTITGDEDIIVEDGWEKISDTVYTKEYSENGKYSVVVKDKVGNETTVNFEVKRIDKVAPTAIITKSNNDKSTNQDVVVTLVSDEAIYKPEGWTEVKTNKEHEFTKTYSENGKYSVVIKDKAGNETTINFEVKRIDRVAPEITVVDPNKYYLEAGEEYVDKGYSAYDEVDKDVTNLVKISYQFQAEGSSNWEGVDTLDTTKLGVYKLTYTAYDKAGNTAKGTRVVAIRDTKAPKFIGLEDGGIYNPATIQVDDATLKTITVYSKDSKETIEVENGYVIDKAGSYEITAIDQKNNKTTINVKVDITVPTYTFNEGYVEHNNVYGTLNLKLHDENGIASVVINGTQLPHTGYYVDINDGDAYTFKNGENTVTVTDEAGNTVTYTFIVDKNAPTYGFNGGTIENNGVYGTLNLKLHDENGIASVIINGTQLPHTGYYVDINDGDAYTFKNGENIVIVTDNLGNTETYTFVVDKKAPTYSISDGTIEDNGVYETLNLKLHDENGIASVVINGTQLPHTGYYVDINDGHAYTFKNGENIVVVTDIFGNTETYSFNLVK